MVSKIYKLGIVIFILLLMSCDNKKVLTTYPNDNIRVESTLKGGNGHMVEYYENGNIKSKGEWKAGSLDGIFTHYYPDGVLKEETIWKNDVRAGESKLFYESGNIKSKAQYKNGVKVSAIFYYEDGKVLERQLYNPDERLIYVAKLDTTGLKYLESLIPVVTPEKDTIYTDELYKVTIHFGLPLTGDVKVYTGEFKKGTSEFVDSIEVEEIEPYVFQYVYKPKKAGVYSIPFKFEHVTHESDSLSLDRLQVKHSIYVLDL